MSALGNQVTGGERWKIVENSWGATLGVRRAGRRDRQAAPMLQDCLC